MKISAVTISFNQANYLKACLDSVAAQHGPWEHIIVDPGSSDGSREIIEARRSQFSHVIFERDEGPADGLNRGFGKAAGDIFYFLNSDDTVLPGAFDIARAAFSCNEQLDVLSGHGYVINESGKRLRRIWSDRPSRHEFAVGTAILIQPSTFIRSKAFRAVGGFNKHNRSNWDGELFVDMFLAGRKFEIVDEFLSEYRIHGASITGSGMLDCRIRDYGRRRYRKIMGREPNWTATTMRAFFRTRRLLRNPRIALDRLTGGKVYGARSG